MTRAEELAAFVVRCSWSDLTPNVREALTLRVLDSLGCAIGALEGPPIRALREQVEDFGGHPRCTLVGGGATSPDRAALHNGALIRYLDFNDSFLAKGETCHPSDNLAAVLAATQYTGGTGRDALTALAVAYQILCRLCEVAPVRHVGFDHVALGSFAVAAGVSKALGLTRDQTANAVAIAGTSGNALRVTRTGTLSQWKGLAYPAAAFGATHAAFLAMRGITGPLEVFEGNKGFMDAISGPFEIDWQAEKIDAVLGTSIKRFNAEVHAQSAIEAVLEVRAERPIAPEEVERIAVEVFDVAYQIIGGGEEGQKTDVRTKEQADHSLPYMVAAALIDGELGPAQYEALRIERSDVQGLMRRVVVQADPDLSRRFPAEHPCRLRIVLDDGTVIAREKRDYEGFFTRPMPLAAVVAKFHRLAEPFADRALRDQIVSTVLELESRPIADLFALLERVRPPAP